MEREGKEGDREKGTPSFFLQIMKGGSHIKVIRSEIFREKVKEVTDFFRISQRKRKEGDNNQEMQPNCHKIMILKSSHFPINYFNNFFSPLSPKFFNLVSP